MDDQQLRALIRDVVARRLAAHAAPPPQPTELEPATAAHFSQQLYVTLVNAGDACLIEPGVTCNHCGYCKTHGH